MSSSHAGSRWALRGLEQDEKGIVEIEGFPPARGFRIRLATSSAYTSRCLLRPGASRHPARRCPRRTWQRSAGVYERWLEDDAAAFQEPDGETIELHPALRPIGGVNDVYRGHEGVRARTGPGLRRLRGLSPRGGRPDRCGRQGHHAAIDHGRGRSSGAAVESRRTAHVWTMRANKAVRLDLYLDRAKALESRRAAGGRRLSSPIRRARQGRA